MSQTQADFHGLVARLRPGEKLGDRIIKVNHAGEHGAVNIYRGQILAARLVARHLIPELDEFKSHEQRHRALFGAELARRGRARCRSYHLCGAGGFALGFVTGLLGVQAIAATTVAVESVVLEHLRLQFSALTVVDEPAAEAINSIVMEEAAHHDLSLKAVNPSGFWFRVISPIVRYSTEAVIWLGMRL
jgi:ubiquinone biosynthesis monooxygenase Coq7